MLDRLVPDRPLVVLERNGHVAYVNSAALAQAGLDRHTPDPATARYIRGSSDELTGRLEEAPAIAAFAVGMPLVTGGALLIRELIWCAAGQVVTLLHDCGIGSIDETTDLEVLRRAIEADTPVRTGACR